MTTESLSDVLSNVHRVAADFFPKQLPDLGGRQLVSTRVDRNYFYQQTGALREQYFSGNPTLPSPNDQAPEDRAALINHFLSRHTEYVLVHDGVRAVAWLYGEMADDETFYFRNAAVDSRFRGNNLMLHLGQHVISYLGQLGYRRFTSHHWGHSQPILITSLQVGFYIVGLSHDERWGCNVHTLLLTDNDRRSELRRQLRGDCQLDRRIVASGDRSAFEDGCIQEVAQFIESRRTGKRRDSDMRSSLWVRPFDRDALLYCLRSGYSITSYSGSKAMGGWVGLEKCNDAADRTCRNKKCHE